jgi:hypothetical protein
VRYGRLFDLAETKSSTVADIFPAVWGAGGEAWVWRRQLWAWEEEMLGECQTLLLTMTVQVDSPDRWRPDPVSGYLVRDAYQILTSQDAVNTRAADDLLWHRQVPLKVPIFAWRLLRVRLPTKANLVTRGIISPDLHLCVTGCVGVETMLEQSGSDISLLVKINFDDNKMLNLQLVLLMIVLVCRIIS